MQSVTLIRHCQSEFNVLEDKKEKTNDRKLVDCEITELGIEQAKKIEGEFDFVFVSPMKRTKQTLTLSKIKAKHIIEEPLVREQKVDICDIMEHEEFKKETDEQVDNRVQIMKNKLLNFKDKRVCIVAHRDFIFHFTKKLVGSEYFGKYLKNGESILYTF